MIRRYISTYRLLACSALLCAAATSAQVTTPTPGGAQSRAVLLEALNNYQGALDLRSVADASLANRLHEAYDIFGRGDYERAAQMFKAIHADHHSSAEAIIGLGDCQLALGKYESARHYYAEIATETLTPPQQSAIKYRRALCFFYTGDTDSAKSLLGSLKGEFANPAQYYLGIIAFNAKDFVAAKSHFDRVRNADLRAYVPYYTAQIDFANGQWEKALATARQNLNRWPEMMRIAGESSLKLGQKDEGIDYLRKYLSATDSPALSALYFVGVKEYNKGNYERASQLLTPVTQDSESVLGQSACLYLGQTLMHLDDPGAAVLAFEKASRSNADEDVRQAAYYNLAVARLQGGTMPFASMAETFDEFLKLYPSSPYASRVAKYLAEGYLSDRAFDTALRRINAVTNPSPELLEAKKRVLYSLAWQDFTEGQYAKALSQIAEAEKIDSFDDKAVDSELALVKGFCLNATGQFAKAAYAFELFLYDNGTEHPNYANAQYGHAYALYNSGKADKAEKAFEKALKATTDGATKSDILSRLGDLRYAADDFAGAADFYAKAYDVSPRNGDYPLLARARMNGYLRRYDAKLAQLQHFVRDFSNSHLLSEAMLETAATQINLGRNADAVASYNKVIKDFSQTAAARRAAIGLAMTLLDMNRRDEAIDAYKFVISNYPTSDEAAQASVLLKNLYAEHGQGDRYLDFMNSVDKAPVVELAEAERLSYEAAVQKYRTENTTAPLEAFIVKYPASNRAPHVLAYLMEAAEGDKKIEFADNILAKYPDHAVAEQALAIKAQALYDKGDMPAALELWQKALEKATGAENTVNAQTGIMRTARDLGKWKEASAAAEKIITLNPAPALRLEALFTQGLALDEEGNKRKALEVWQKGASEPNLPYGARCAYHAAEAQFALGNKDKALKAAQKFVQSGSSQRYWVARGFILLSDIYKSMGKKFEAKEYLQALRDNYPGEETDIFMMIDSRLSDL